MERYYLNYLKSITNDPLILKYIDLLKVEIDWRFYADGRDLANKYHWGAKQAFLWEVYKKYQELRALLSKKQAVEGTQILTMFKFPSIVDGFHFYSSVSHPVGKNNIIGDIATLKLYKFSRDVINNYPFNKILVPEVLIKLEEYEELLYKLYFVKNNIRALFLYTDQYFWAKQHINLFKKTNRPSFIFVHGLPPYYPLDADNQSDYLMVWGEKMKQNYIDSGFNRDKIKVIGNFRYKDVVFYDSLKNNTDDVLVVLTSTRVWHQDTWGSIPIISDPGSTLLYISQIENVLKQLGVKHARLRPHPSINKQWLYSIIDPNFYEIDKQDLTSSLLRSTLVIGPTSTVSVESIMYGVNYIVYEPCDEKNYNFVNRNLAPPFDGSDPYLCVANTEDELLHLIKGRYCSSSSLLKEYMQPFVPQVLKELI